MHILIADDDRIIITLLSSLLRRGGHRVSIAADGMQAFMYARRNQPDLVLLDINMPGGTGFEVLQRLKSATTTSTIPVIVVSGNNDEVSRQRALQLGADNYLCKLDGMDNAIGVINRFLNEQGLMSIAG